MIPTLVSFQMAKIHMGLIDRNDQDMDLRFKLELASRIVVNHCKWADVPLKYVEIDPEDFDSQDLVSIDALASPPPSSPPGQYYVRVPGNMQAAILLVLGELFNVARESSSGEVLSDTVKDLLAPFRDPTFS